MSGTADLHEAIVTAWDAASLDTHFTNLWSSDVVASEWVVLNDGDTSPAQPMPYCVVEQSPGVTTARMTGAALINREIRDVPVQFRVHAKAVDGDSRDAKKIAIDLINEIMKVYGGHPTESPSALELDNGNFLIGQYQNDYGVRTGDDEHQWIIEYLFRLDVPVAL